MAKADRRSIVCAVILTPIVLVLLVLSWLHGAARYDEQLPVPSADEYIISGYFVNWGIYDRNYNVIDVKDNANKLSHVLYAFANLDAEGNIVLGDPWADTDKHFPAEQTIDGKADLWDDTDSNLFGNLKQFYLLKRENRHLKVSLSIGGWSWSKNFSTVAADSKKRAVFSKSAATLVQDLGLDGIDIDWEVPKNDNEAKSYVDLVRDLRQALDDLDNSPYLISVAVPCGPQDYRKLHLKEMAEYVDLFNLMAYDFAGAWDEKTGHQAALYGGQLNDRKVVEDYIKAGVPSHKLVLGIPVYGRAFSDTDGPNSAFKGVPVGTWEAGSYDYKQLPRPGAQEFVDTDVMASYSYDSSLREFVTYDNPAVVEAKCGYAKEMGLGGVMFWELSADVKEGPRSLLETAYTTLKAVDQTSNHIRFEQSRYDNIRSLSSSK